MITITIAAGVSGGFVSYTGRYWYVLVVGPLILSIGSGLMFGLMPYDSPSSKLIGFQILYAIGLGYVSARPLIIQTV